MTVQFILYLQLKFSTDKIFYNKNLDAITQHIRNTMDIGIGVQRNALK